MGQRWSNLLFAHWSVSPDALRALVPPALILDLHEGKAWVTVTPFLLSGLRLRGLPAFPAVSEFPELNVRTYVTLGGRPGVWFFSLDAGSFLAVTAARALFHLPYFEASMGAHASRDGTIHYHSRRIDSRTPAAEFRAGYAPDGPAATADSGSLDHFLVERYCLYALDRRQRVFRTEIHHRPWPLQPARVHLERNTMGDAAGITLTPVPDRVSFSRRLDVAVWMPEEVKLD
jgi:uncharacterized protein YqjF (DUF2071 family)